MARRCSRATSLLAPVRQTRLRKAATMAFWVCLSLTLPSAAEAGLYTDSDMITVLTPENVQSVLVNSTAATVVEFYASWCGHCVSFSPIYKSLARDIKEWRPAVNLAAIDCAAEENRKVCVDYKIKGYPSIKFFHAYSKADSLGEDIRGFPREVRGLRHIIIDNLEKHGEPWPPACPPLEPISKAEVDVFFETNNCHYLALIFESTSSHIGQEAILDLLQFENITVRRALSTEKDLVKKLNVTEFPSCYLYYPDGTFSRLQVGNEARIFYTYALARLPGVVRSGKPLLVNTVVITNKTAELWRPFNRTRVYMADLESALHYSLRVELAAHSVIQGEALSSLKSYIAVLAKYFPGRVMVTNMLKSLDTWLQNQSSDSITYEAFKEILDNTAQAPNTALPEGVRWVACQGSQPHFRRYPCGVWTLFHVLTVQTKSEDPLEVLNAMRGYVRHFFGCRDCAAHFETMASESLARVDSHLSAVLWLWSRHNQVNNRVAGALSEDPYFPKTQWPPPDLCSSCHKVMSDGEHSWDLDRVHPFLMSYYSSNTILTGYLEDESKVLEKQRDKHDRQQVDLLAQAHARRKAREASNLLTPTTSSPVQEKVGDEEEVYEEEESEDGAPAVAGEMETNPGVTAWTKDKLERGHDRLQIPKKPSIVGMRMRQAPEDIVDLDLFVNQHFGARALRFHSPSLVKQRTLKRKAEQEPRAAFGLGMELDAGVGMVGLQPIDEDMEVAFGGKVKRLQKRELADKYYEDRMKLGHRRRWMSVLGLGFSQLDISLCIILYFLSTTCLIAMYFFFKNRFKRRRIKVALP